LPCASGSSLGIWSTRSWTKATTLAGHTDTVFRAYFSPDGQLLGTAGADSYVRIWDLKSGQELVKVGGGFRDIVDFGFAPDSKKIVFTGEDKYVRVYDIGAKRTIRQISLGNTGTAVAFRPDGKQLIVGTADNLILSYDTSTWARVLTLSDHLSAPRRFSYNAAGDRFLSGAADGKVILWDSGTGKPLHTFSGHTGAAHAVRFSPDGLVVMTGGGDRTLRFWGVGNENWGCGGVCVLNIMPMSTGVTRPTCEIWGAARSTRLPAAPAVRAQAHVEGAERLTFHPVEIGYDEVQARREGARCLHCWINTEFDSRRAEASECIQCRGCVDVCPEGCIDLVSTRRIHVAEDEDLSVWRLPNRGAADALSSPRGVALIKDESACIRCGLCARRCPVNCIRMEGFYRTDEFDLLHLADHVV